MPCLRIPLRKDSLSPLTLWCFDIPVIILGPIVPPGPVEIDLGRTENHLNWVTVDGKNPEWAGELRSLATIAALARRSPALQQGLQNGLQEIARTIQAKMPEGVEIHFDEPAYPATHCRPSA
jgi:hypothetical protein